jgi:hypothetical protein
MEMERQCRLATAAARHLRALTYFCLVMWLACSIHVEAAAAAAAAVKPTSSSVDVSFSEKQYAAVTACGGGAGGNRMAGVGIMRGEKSVPLTAICVCVRACVTA